MAEAKNLNNNSEYYLINEAPFNQPVINIGQDSGNDLVLSGTQIEPFQAILFYQEPRWVIQSLAEESGIKVNRQSVSGAGLTVNDQDFVYIGDYRLKIIITGESVDIYVYQKTTAADTSKKSIDFSNSDEKKILLDLVETPTEVMPGGSVEYHLEVTNAGPLVAAFQIQVQGLPVEWLRFDPPLLNLNEGQRGHTTITVAPPQNSLSRAGEYKVRFIITSINYRHQMAQADAVLNVLPYYDFLIGSLNPRQIGVSFHKRTGETSLPIINNSNTNVDFNVMTTDEQNTIVFEHEISDVRSSVRNAVVPVEAGKTRFLPIHVTPNSIPIISFVNRIHPFNVAVNVPGQESGVQTTTGQVKIKPLINFLLLLLILLILAAGLALLLQPRIISFTTSTGENVIRSGTVAHLQWKVSPFASTLTISAANSEPVSVTRGQKTMNVSPTALTSYVLTAENWVSRLLQIEHKKTVNILVIPNQPRIDLLEVSEDVVNAGDTVTLRWSVSDNAEKAKLTINQVDTLLTKETFSGEQQLTIQKDTLVSITAENSSGTMVKSRFINANNAEIELLRYTIWVKPEQTASISAPGLRARPETQDVLIVPNLGTTEELSTNTGTTEEQQAPSTVQEIVNTSGSASTQGVTLTTSGKSSSSETTAPITTAPISVPQQLQTIQNLNTPSSRVISSVFTEKLVEMISDPTSPTGYRVINYQPERLLNPGEEIMIEWDVDGVTTVKITPLSTDALSSIGNQTYFPTESMNFTLNAKLGDEERSFLLPVAVSTAGEAKPPKIDSFTASPTAINCSGYTTLTWSVSQTWTRIQLISSVQAAKDEAERKEKLKKEADAAGEKYVEPTTPLPDSGLLVDYLPQTGSLQMKIGENTNFTLRAWNNTLSASNVQAVTFACTEETGKTAVGLSITTLLPEKRPYSVGDTVEVFTAFSGLNSDKAAPTGVIKVTDGVSQCAITLPAQNSCKLTFKTAGVKTITATYIGDTVYKQAAAERKVVSTDKASSFYNKTILVSNTVTTTTTIKKLDPTSATGSYLKGELVSVYAVVSPSLYGYDGSEPPIGATGLVTVKAGSASCTYLYNASDDTKNFCKLALSDLTATNITATYAGDGIFLGSTSGEVPIQFQTKNNTMTGIVLLDPDTLLPGGTSRPYLRGDRIRAYVVVQDAGTPAIGKPITGTITVKAGSVSCPIEYNADDPYVDTAHPGSNYCEMVLSDTTAAGITAAYAGNENYYNGSVSSDLPITISEKIKTVTTIDTIDPDSYTESAKNRIYIKDDIVKVHASVAPETYRDKEISGKVTVSAGEANCSYVYKPGSNSNYCTLKLSDIKATSISASYAGDSVFATSTSDNIEIIMLNQVVTTTTLTLNPEPKEKSGVYSYSSGQTVTVVVSVLPDAVYSEYISYLNGKVTVKVGENSCTINNYNPTGTNACQLTLSTIGDNLPIKASYEGNTIFSASAANAVTLKNGTAVSTVTVKKRLQTTIQFMDDFSTRAFIVGEKVDVKVKITTENSPLAESLETLTVSNALTTLTDGKTTSKATSYPSTWTKNYGEGNVFLNASMELTIPLTLTDINATTLTAEFSGNDELLGSKASTSIHYSNVGTKPTDMLILFPTDSFQVKKGASYAVRLRLLDHSTGLPLTESICNAGTITVTDGDSSSASGWSCADGFITGSMTASVPGLKTLTALYSGQKVTSGVQSQYYGPSSAGMAFVEVLPADSAVKQTVTRITQLVEDKSVYALGESVNVTVKVVDASDSSAVVSGQVAVYTANMKNVCTLSYPYENSCPLNLNETGESVQLFARYYGNDVYQYSTSDPRSVKVVTDAGDIPTKLTITGIDGGDPAVAGLTRTVGTASAISLALENKDGESIVGLAFGSILVSDGAGDTCRISLEYGNTAAPACSLTFKTTGRMSLTASYYGDLNYKASQAEVVPVTVITKADRCATTIKINSFKDVTSNYENVKSVNHGNKVQTNFTVDSSCAVYLYGDVKVTFTQENNKDHVITCTKSFKNASVATNSDCTATMTNLVSSYWQDYIVTAEYLGDANTMESTVTYPEKFSVYGPGEEVPSGLFTILGVSDSKNSITTLSEVTPEECIKGNCYMVVRADISSTTDLNNLKSLYGYDDSNHGELRDPPLPSPHTDGKYYYFIPVKFSIPGKRDLYGKFEFSQAITVANGKSYKSGLILPTAETKSVTVVTEEHTLPVIAKWEQIRYKQDGLDCTKEDGYPKTIPDISTSDLAAGYDLQFTGQYDLEKLFSKHKAAYEAYISLNTGSAKVGEIFAKVCGPDGICSVTASKYAWLNKENNVNYYLSWDKNDFTKTISPDPFSIQMTQAGNYKITLHFIDTTTNGISSNATSIEYTVPVGKGTIYYYPTEMDAGVGKTGLEVPWSLPNYSVEDTTYSFSAWLARGIAESGKVPSCKVELNDAAGQTVVPEVPIITINRESNPAAMETWGEKNCSWNGWMLECDGAIEWKSNLTFAQSVGDANYQTDSSFSLEASSEGVYIAFSPEPSASYPLGTKPTLGVTVMKSANVTKVDSVVLTAKLDEESNKDAKPISCSMTGSTDETHQYSCELKTTEGYGFDWIGSHTLTATVTYTDSVGSHEITKTWRTGIDVVSIPLIGNISEWTGSIQALDYSGLSSASLGGGCTYLAKDKEVYKSSQSRSGKNGEELALSLTNPSDRAYLTLGSRFKITTTYKLTDGLSTKFAETDSGKFSTAYTLTFENNTLSRSFTGECKINSTDPKELICETDGRLNMDEGMAAYGTKVTAVITLKDGTGRFSGSYSTKLTISNIEKGHLIFLPWAGSKTARSDYKSYDWYAAFPLDATYFNPRSLSAYILQDNQFQCRSDFVVAKYPAPNSNTVVTLIDTTQPSKETWICHFDGSGRTNYRGYCDKSGGQSIQSEKDWYISIKVDGAEDPNYINTGSSDKVLLHTHSQKSSSETAVVLDSSVIETNTGTAITAASSFATGTLYSLKLSSDSALTAEYNLVSGWPEMLAAANLTSSSTSTCLNYVNSSGNIVIPGSELSDKAFSCNFVFLNIPTSGTAPSFSFSLESALTAQAHSPKARAQVSEVIPEIPEENVAEGTGGLQMEPVTISDLPAKVEKKSLSQRLSMMDSAGTAICSEPDGCVLLPGIDYTIMVTFPTDVADSPLTGAFALEALGTPTVTLAADWAEAIRAAAMDDLPDACAFSGETGSISLPFTFAAGTPQYQSSCSFRLPTDAMLKDGAVTLHNDTAFYDVADVSLPLRLTGLEPTVTPEPVPLKNMTLILTPAGIVDTSDQNTFFWSNFSAGQVAYTFDAYIRAVDGTLTPLTTDLLEKAPGVVAMKPENQDGSLARQWSDCGWSADAVTGKWSLSCPYCIDLKIGQTIRYAFRTETEGIQFADEEKDGLSDSTLRLVSKYRGNKTLVLTPQNVTSSLDGSTYIWQSFDTFMPTCSFMANILEGESLIPMTSDAFPDQPGAMTLQLTGSSGTVTEWPNCSYQLNASMQWVLTCPNSGGLAAGTTIRYRFNEPDTTTDPAVKPVLSIRVGADGLYSSDSIATGTTEAVETITLQPSWVSTNAGTGAETAHYYGESLSIGEMYELKVTASAAMTDDVMLTGTLPALMSPTGLDPASGCLQYMDAAGTKLSIPGGLFSAENSNTFRCSIKFNQAQTLPQQTMTFTLDPMNANAAFTMNPLVWMQFPTVVAQVALNQGLTLSEGGNLLCTEQFPCGNVYGDSIFTLTYSWPTSWNTSPFGGLTDASALGTSILTWPADWADAVRAANASGLTANLENPCQIDSNNQTVVPLSFAAGQTNYTYSCRFMVSGTLLGAAEPLSVHNDSVVFNAADAALTLPATLLKRQVALTPSLTLQMNPEDAPSEGIVSNHIAQLYRSPSQIANSAADPSDIALYTLRGTLSGLSESMPLAANEAILVNWNLLVRLAEIGELPSCLIPMGNSNYQLGTLVNEGGGTWSASCSFRFPASLPVTTESGAMTMSFNSSAYATTAQVGIGSLPFANESVQIAVAVPAQLRLFQTQHFDCSLTSNGAPISGYARALLRRAGGLKVTMTWPYSAMTSCQGIFMVDPDAGASCSFSFSEMIPASTAYFDYVDPGLGNLMAISFIPQNAFELPGMAETPGTLHMELWHGDTQMALPAAPDTRFVVGDGYSLRFRLVPDAGFEDALNGMAMDAYPVAVTWAPIPGGSAQIILQPDEGGFSASYDFRFDMGGVTFSDVEQSLAVSLTVPGWVLSMEPAGQPITMPGGISLKASSVNIGDVYAASDPAVPLTAVSAGMDARIDVTFTGDLNFYDPLKMTVESVIDGIPAPLTCQDMGGGTKSCVVPASCTDIGTTNWPTVCSNDITLRAVYQGDGRNSPSGEFTRTYHVERAQLTFQNQPSGFNQSVMRSVQVATEDMTAFGWAEISVNGWRMDQYLVRETQSESGERQQMNYPVNFSYQIAGSSAVPDPSKFWLEVVTEFAVPTDENPMEQSVRLLPSGSAADGQLNFVLDFSSAVLSADPASALTVLAQAKTIKRLTVHYEGDAAIASSSFDFAAEELYFPLKVVNELTLTVTAEPNLIRFGGAAGLEGAMTVYSVYCSQLGAPLNCYASDPTAVGTEQRPVLDEAGNPVTDEAGNPVYEEVPLSLSEEGCWGKVQTPQIAEPAIFASGTAAPACYLVGMRGEQIVIGRN